MSPSYGGNERKYHGNCYRVAGLGGVVVVIQKGKSLSIIV